MITKAEVKLIRSLQQKRKTRRRYGLFVVEGPRSLDLILKSGAPIEKIYATKSWINRHEDLLKTRNIPYKAVTQSELKTLSSLATPNQVLALVSIPRWFQSEEDILANPPSFFLVATGIQDPGNLGTIIRSAHWFGAALILADEDTADAFNPKVVQASMGSVIHVPIFYGDVAKILSDLKREMDLLIIGADPAGPPLNEKKIAERCRGKKVCLVVGSEAHGISEAVKPLLDEIFSIEPYSEEPPDSLNVAVATGIFLYILRRAFTE